MTNHGAAVGAAIGPIVAGEVLLVPGRGYRWGEDPAMGKGSAMGVRTRQHIVLVIRPFRPDSAVDQFAALGQRRRSIDQISIALDVTM
jgi:hypothetical protein